MVEHKNVSTSRNNQPENTSNLWWKCLQHQSWNLSSSYEIFLCLQGMLRYGSGNRGKKASLETVERENIVIILYWLFDIFIWWSIFFLSIGNEQDENWSPHDAIVHPSQAKWPPKREKLQAQGTIQTPTLRVSYPRK